MNILKILNTGKVVLAAIAQIELLGQPVTFRIGNESFTITKVQ